MDILPIYIHGNSEIIPKGDFNVYDGHIFSVIGKRIAWNDETFGKTYSERTKKISKEFKSNFQQVRNQFEDENYFKQKLFLSFLYKENEVVHEVKKDFKQNKHAYYQLNHVFLSDEKIVHYANDYGQIDFLLVMQQANRKILSFIKDEENREIASTNYILKKRTLNYISEFNAQDDYKTLLLSTEIDEFYNEIILQFDKIVVLKNRGINLSIFNSCTNQKETNEYIVYTR